MLKRRRYGRRFRRRLRRRGLGRRRPRYLRYKSKKRGMYRRKRSRGGIIGKMLKSLLPTVPIKYCRTYNGQGQFGSKTWWSDTIGAVADANTYKDYLPGQSNIYDTGAGGTSTSLSFQQFASKKFKFKHVAHYVGQNVANTTMILTIHIIKFRTDYNIIANPSITSHLNADCGTSTNSGNCLLNSNSTLPAGSYIGNYYAYPQFTLFMSNNTTSTFKVVRTINLRVPPGGWFKFKLNTGYKEFDKQWLANNAARTDKIEHMRNWSKMAAISWHGELVQKANDVGTTTLAATDFILYANHSLKLKAVPFHRQSIVLKPPVYLDTTSPLSWTPQVRPKGVVQITTTSTSAQDKGP